MSSREEYVYRSKIEDDVFELCVYKVITAPDFGKTKLVLHKSCIDQKQQASPDMQHSDMMDITWDMEDVEDDEELEVWFEDLPYCPVTEAMRKLTQTVTPLKDVDFWTDEDFDEFMAIERGERLIGRPDYSLCTSREYI